jgi:hypothetical protein
MPEPGLYESLPPYLRRYLTTWLPSLGDEECWLNYTGPSRDEWIRSSLDRRQKGGLNYLALTMRDIRFAALDEREVIDLLAEIPSVESTSVLVTELVRRLPDMAEDSKSYLATVLSSMAEVTQDAADKRTAADRALMRLLYRMDCDAAFQPAAVCARSERKIRREASYRFYLKYGLDETAREILAEQVWQDSERYRRTITTDIGIVRKLGLANVLLMAPTSYWRMRAIGCALQGDDDAEVLATCEDYPLELTWAVNVGCIKRLLPEVLELLDRYAADPYLLNRVLQCLVVLGDPAGLALGMERAAKTMEAAGLEPRVGDIEERSA